MHKQGTIKIYPSTMLNLLIFFLLIKCGMYLKKLKEELRDVSFVGFEECKVVRNMFGGRTTEIVGRVNSLKILQ